MEQVIKPTDLDISKIVYTEPKPMGTSGAKSMYMNYGSGQKSIALVAPKMRLPYGIGTYVQDGQPPKYTLDLSFGDKDADPKLKQFYEAIESINEKLIADAKKNSLLWLRKKTISEDVIRELFSSPIKRSKDKETGEITNKYPPTLKAKIPVRDEKFLCVVWDHKKGLVEDKDAIVQNLTKGTRVATILKCGGVWFSGGKFGVSWKVDQIKLEKPQNLVAYAFRDDEE